MQTGLSGESIAIALEFGWKRQEGFRTLFL
jgi:hypothetical protein